MTFLGASHLVVLAALSFNVGYFAHRLRVGDLRNSPQFQVCMSAVFMSLLSVNLVARELLPNEFWNFPYALAAPIAVGYLLGRAQTARQKRRASDRMPEPTERTATRLIGDEGASR